MENRRRRNTPQNPERSPSDAHCPGKHSQRKRTPCTIASLVVATLLGLAPAGAALRPAPLRAALGRTLRLPLAALLRGRLPARGTSLRRHGSTDSKDSRVRDNYVFDLEYTGRPTKLQNKNALDDLPLPRNVATTNTTITPQSQDTPPTRRPPNAERDTKRCTSKTPPTTAQCERPRAGT